MTDDDRGQEVERSLVMPFVVCVSQGGPYDDVAFVAGYQAGRLDVLLQTLSTCGGTGARFMVYADLAPQLDLIGMRWGYAVTVEPTGVEGWSYATFALAAPTPGSMGDEP